LDVEALKFIQESDGKDCFYQVVTGAHPNGFGYMELMDSDPHSPVVIHPKYMQDDLDMKILIDG